MPHMSPGQNQLNAVEAMILAGDYADASSALTEILSANPGNAPALHLSALVALAAQQFSDAIAHLQRATVITPNPLWLRDLGVTYLMAGMPQEALEPFERCAQERPNDPALLLLRARTFITCKRPAEALSLLSYPMAEAHHDDLLTVRGEALAALGSYEAALQVFTTVCEHKPHSESAHERCARVAILNARFDLAVDHLRTALALAQDKQGVSKTLAFALWIAGEMDESLSLSRRNCEADPADLEAYAVYLRAVDHFSPSAQQSREAWERWATAANRGVQPLALNGERCNPERRLRVGYLVDDMHRGPNAYFIPPLINNHNSMCFDVFCYLTGASDAERPHLQSMNVESRDLRECSAADIAAHVQRDEIDILVNVSWERRERNLSVFGYRAAPVQIELPHYPATTGHPETDFILTDSWICPAGSESIYSETAYRLRDSYMAWTPPDPSPQVIPPPITRNGFCTFGLFQKASKFNPLVWDSVCKVLHCVPASRLLFHQRCADLDIPGSKARERAAAQLAHRAIDPNRLQFVGSRDQMSHLEVVSQCDIALDTFPYNGTTTTGDCFWMGVPVVTFIGETHAGRLGLSMLSRLGQPQWAAPTLEGYVEVAAQLAADTTQLLELRRSLRQQMIDSPLTQPKTVMMGIEVAYRDMWSQYCRSEMSEACMRRKRNYGPK